MDRFNGSFQNERASLKVSQLERKWKHILEEERRSCLRNKKLLEDFDQIKQQSKVFSKKTDRLKHAKHNFELYVKSIYPRWTEELKQLQELKKNKTTKESKPPSTDIKLDDCKEKKHSEISGYVDSKNVLLNPTLSSTPYWNAVSFTEPERLSGGLEEGNQMPKYSGYINQQYSSNSNQRYPSNSNQQYPSNSNQQYPSNSNQQYPSNGGHPIGHPMSNLSNSNRGWVHPEALHSGMFPYLGNVSIPRPHHAMPWQNMNHSAYGGQGRYGFNPGGVSYFEMSDIPPRFSQSFQDYQGNPKSSGNYHGNSAEERASQHPHQRDHDSYVDGIHQTSRHGQKHDDADPTHNINDSKSTYIKIESLGENDEQPKTRHVSENYANPGNHKTFQGEMVEKSVEYDGDTNYSTDLKDNVGNHQLLGDSFKEESAHEIRQVVGKIGKTRDPEIEVVKETKTEVSDVSTDFDNVKTIAGNSGGSPIQLEVNSATNQEPTDTCSSQGRKDENDQENSLVDSDSHLSINQDHNEHSVTEQMSKDSSNELPESDVDSSPFNNTPKGLKGPQNMHQDSSPQPTDSAQITNTEKSPEREVPRKEEAKTSIMDDLVGDDVISDFEISGSEISEDVPNEHEFVTGCNKENIQMPENITEQYDTVVPEMKDLKVEDNEAISKPNDNSASNSKEPIDINDAETVANTEIQLQDKRENFSLPKNKEERNEILERDFQIDSKEESKDSQGKEEVSHDLDPLSKRQGEEQRSDEEKSGVLEDLSFTSEDSSSQSISLKKKSDREKSGKKNDTRESMSYSEDFEDEKSIFLTETDAYQKMLSSVKFSDDEEDLEEDLLAGSTVSEVNIINQTSQDDDKQLPVSEPLSISKIPAKVSKSKPKLSVFSSGEAGLENSFGKDSEGILTSSWKSSEMSLSPPLSPDMDLGGYVPTAVGGKKVDGKEVDGKDRKETDEGNKGEDGKDVLSTSEKEQKKVKQDAGKEKQESKTKSRIQAGFWNHSDTESEVDLQVSHEAVDDDDDFDFYS